MAVRTLDTELEADERYFRHAQAPWLVHFDWPVPDMPDSIVDPVESWTKPSAPERIDVNDVNIVPAVTLGTAPYTRLIPSME